MTNCKLRIELRLDEAETLLIVQVVTHLSDLQDDGQTLVPRELADRLSSGIIGDSTPEDEFARLFGTAPPSWDVHPNAWPYGLAIVTDIGGKADGDQLVTVLRFLLSESDEAALASGKVSRSLDSELWRALAADKRWLNDTTIPSLGPQQRR